MKKKANGKLIFNLIVTLLLALAVTGLGKPGFLLKYLRPKEPAVRAEDQVRPSPLPARGRSDPFSVEPLPGFTISAERDAMDRNRTFTVKELAWETLSGLEARLMEKGAGIMLLSGWEVDAGLSDDERIPGTYTVGIDLTKLRIPERLYGLLKAYRVDDAGNLYEYVTWVKDNVLFYASCQNSGTVIGVDEEIAVTGKELVIESAAPETGFFEKDGVYWVRNPSDPSVKQYQIIYKQDEVESQISNQNSTILSEKASQAREEAKAQLPEGAPNDEINALALEIKQRMYEEDPVYRDAMDARYNTRKERAEKNKEMVCRIGTMAYEAHKYLQTLDIRLPVEETVLYLVPSLDSGAFAETEPVSWNPYVNVNLSTLETGSKWEFDEMQLTLAHELFHVCQFRYNGAAHANVKFYEAMAQLLEEDAYRYFRSHKNVTGEDNVVTTEHGLENGRHYHYYAIPFNDKKVTYYEDMGSASTWTLSDAEYNSSGYPLARFMEYLNDAFGKKSFKEMLDIHESVVAYVDFGALNLTEHLKTTWCLSNEELTQAYLAFAKKYQTNIYTYQQANVQNRKMRVAYPISTLGADHARHFKLIDHAYSIRINEILSSSLDIVARVGHLLVPDEDFSDQLPDMTLMPIGAAQWTKCKYGLFFYPHLEGAIFIMEIDGGTNPNTSGASGYTVYQLDPPKLEEVEVADGLFSFKLPEKSKAAQDGKIDGYRVTITCSDGKKTVYYPKIVIAGQTVKLKTSRLNLGKNKEDEELSYTITVCEYIRDGRRMLFGPESNPDDMDSLLEEMGAVEGEITCSIYWPSKDDLDLHCITPEGGHIYFSNKFSGGGQLDVDMQVEGDRDSGVENIYFAEPTPGQYQFYINNYTDRTEGDTNCRIRIKVGNQILVDETVAMGGRSKTYKLTYGGQGQEQNVEVLEGN